jgi:hypothetical protein
MMGLLVGVFLIAHGLIHLAVWLPRVPVPTAAGAGAPFDPHHSWLLGPRSPDVSGRGPAVASAVLYCLAGAAVVIQLESTATSLAVAAATVGVIFKIVYFNPWLLIGIAIDAGVLAAAMAQFPSGAF